MARTKRPNNVKWGECGPATAVLTLRVPLTWKKWLSSTAARFGVTQTQFAVEAVNRCKNTLDVREHFRYRSSSLPTTEPMENNMETTPATENSTKPKTKLSKGAARGKGRKGLERITFKVTKLARAFAGLSKTAERASKRRKDKENAQVRAFVSCVQDAAARVEELTGVVSALAASGWTPPKNLSRKPLVLGPHRVIEADEYGLPPNFTVNVLPPTAKTPKGVARCTWDGAGKAVMLISRRHLEPLASPDAPPAA